MTALSLFSCPIPGSASDDTVIALAHGGGGRKMHDLITDIFVEAFRGLGLQPERDSAILALSSHDRLRGILAMTTDSFVVTPWRFPGGDIGSLAVHGTVNDLAMSGALPLWLSVSFIIEEGFLISDLRTIVRSMAEAAVRTGVKIVTGDTKVVERTSGNIFITTTGVGSPIAIPMPGTASFVAIPTPGIDKIEAGDRILVSNDIGRHGIAVMSVREGLDFGGIASDSAPLADIVRTLAENGIALKCMRDCTRGGLATSLIELAQGSRYRFTIDERLIPVSGAVAGACEILGLDPLYVANEGTFIAIVPEHDAKRACLLMRRHEHAKKAAIIGDVSCVSRAGVTLTTAYGNERMLEMFSGEQLPRIC